MPYPVGIFENKFQTSSDKSSMEKSNTSVALGDLPCNFAHHLMSDSDKPHTFTQQQVKLENQDLEEVGQGNYCIYKIV